MERLSRRKRLDTKIFLPEVDSIVWEDLNPLAVEMSPANLSFSVVNSESFREYCLSSKLSSFFNHKCGCADYQEGNGNREYIHE
jgi:hypothetical protein